MHHLWIFLIVFLVIVTVIIFYVVNSSNNSNNSKTIRFNSSLTGSQEVPPVITLSNGSGTFLLITKTDNSGLERSSQTLSYKILFKNLSTPFVSAHFHRGASGVTGPIVRTLTDDVTLTPNRRSGAIEGTWKSTDPLLKDNEPLTVSLVNDLLSGRIYVNIHSQQYPGGEIRGQLNRLLL